jgi:hypothetical protein
MTPEETMNYLDRNSLYATLDSLSEALFFEKSIPEPQRVAAAKWIASRQGLPGAYAGMPAPTKQDGHGVRLFTGETIRSRVGIAHVLGEEACRILALLDLTDKDVQAALDRAVQGFVARLEESEQRGYSPGTYCCGTCSTAYWRNLANHLLPRAEERLHLGLKELKQLRRGNGTWRRFPFYPTCLALTEIGPELAKNEMQYAALFWRNNPKKLASTGSPAARRRVAVGQRLLELCEK